MTLASALTLRLVIPVPTFEGWVYACAACGSLLCYANGRLCWTCTHEHGETK